MLINETKWLLQPQTREDEKYMRPLFSYIFKIFEGIFGTSVMNAETCVLYNDGKADYPMLISNCNPIRIRTNAVDLSYWAQFIYHASHEMTHYVIRQYKADKSATIKWFEETICEAMSLYILHISSMRWTECDLHTINPNYGKALDDYLRNEYVKTEESVLKKCHTAYDLRAIEETCETNRRGRSIERNYLFDTFCVMPNNIAEFVYYPIYMHGDIQIDFAAWESSHENNPLIPHLKSIHPKLTA